MPAICPCGATQLLYLGDPGPLYIWFLALPSPFDLFVTHYLPDLPLHSLPHTHHPTGSYLAFPFSFDFPPDSLFLLYYCGPCPYYCTHAHLPSLWVLFHHLPPPSSTICIYSHSLCSLFLLLGVLCLTDMTYMVPSLVLCTWVTGSDFTPFLLLLPWFCCSLPSWLVVDGPHTHHTVRFWIYLLFTVPLRFYLPYPTTLTHCHHLGPIVVLPTVVPLIPILHQFLLLLFVASLPLRLPLLCLAVSIARYVVCCGHVADSPLPRLFTTCHLRTHTHLRFTCVYFILFTCVGSCLCCYAFTFTVFTVTHLPLFCITLFTHPLRGYFTCTGSLRYSSACTCVCTRLHYHHHTTPTYTFV